MSLIEKHGTGLTMALFAVVMVGLSLAPGPEWLHPLDFIRDEDPLGALNAKLFSKPEALPRASQGYVAGGGGQEGAVVEDTYVEIEADQANLAEVEVIAPAERTPWKMPARPHFDKYAQDLGLKAAPLENPCVQKTGDTCQRYALDRFFRRLADAEDKKPGAVARVVHYGDSLIASDKITDMVRLRLQERYGSAGKGFLLIKKFNSFQRGNRMGEGTGGWILDVITQGLLRDHYFGYTGASFTAQKAGERSVFKDIGKSRLAEVFYLLQRGGGELQVLADNQVVQTIDAQTNAAVKEAQIAKIELPEGTQTMTLRATKPGARVFGVSLEAQVPGVSYESVGLPGATSDVWLLPEPSDFARQLLARDPVLVVTMLGGNDGLMLSKGRTTAEKLEVATREFVKRVQAAVPDADCLMISPLESVRARTDGRMDPKPEVLQVIAIQKKIASEAGCAFWDMHASMGGEGSLKKWVSAGLMLGDLIHPKSRGSDLLGEMMAEALMTAYDAKMARAEN